MRRLAWMVVAAGLPVAGLTPAAWAQDAVIRIEAKRAGDVARSVARWAERFDDVVTFPLPRGWTAIALGPLTPEEARSRMADLKGAGAIPADSFVAVPEAGVALTPLERAAAAAPVAEAEGEAQAGAAPQPGRPAPGAYLRLQTAADPAEAEAALALWRKIFPGAGLAALPQGRQAVVLGPLDRAAAGAWLDLFKTGDLVPDSAVLSDAADLAGMIRPGEAPDLPAPPGTPAAMPPLDEVQRALRWAGLYEGADDGKPGARTQEAIAAEMLASRSSPDPGTAMAALIARRDAWRSEAGLEVLRDTATGLSLLAPMGRLAFDRTERALSIYGPRDGSGAALILFSQPGGQQDLLDLSGLVAALGWVPDPARTIERGHVLLQGANDAHIGRAEGWVRDGRAEGFVLIWPAADGVEQARIAAEMADSFTRTGPGSNETAPEEAPGAAMARP